MRDLSFTTSAIVAIVSLTAAGLTLAGETLGTGHRCANCRTEEVIEYRDVVVHRCKMVPAKRVTKKTVYEVKEVPFCLHKASLPFGCDCCRECQACARTKKVLVKKEVTCEEPCGTKCEVEEVIERQAFKVCRVIPCGTCQTAPVAPISDVPAPVPVPAVDSGK